MPSKVTKREQRYLERTRSMPPPVTDVLVEHCRSGAPLHVEVRGIVLDEQRRRRRVAALRDKQKTGGDS